VTRRDIRFETDTEQPVSAIMTPKKKLVTVKEGAPLEEVQRCCMSTASKKFWLWTMTSV
jgi:CBS domain-containing protein